MSIGDALRRLGPETVVRSAKFSQQTATILSVSQSVSLSLFFKVGPVTEAKFARIGPGARTISRVHTLESVLLDPSVRCPDG